MPDKTRNAVKAVIAAGAVATLATACSSSASGGGTSDSAPAPPGSTVTISLSAGRLTAADGRTLYYNTVDTAKKIDCVAGCATTWPPVLGKPKTGKGVDAEDFTTTTRPDGHLQITYYGHPLYEFSGDSAAGDHHGDGVADGGGKWVVATPEQAAGKGAASSSAPTKSSPSSDGGGGGGYYP